MGSKIPTVEDLRKREYEVQVLDHSVQDIADGVKSIVHDNIITAMNMLQGVLSKKDICNLEKIKHSTATLLQEYEMVATNKHGEIEALVQKTFAVPDHVLLPEDAAQSRQYTQGEVDNIDEEIEKLMKKFKRNLLMKRLLQKEREILQDIENRVALVNKIESRRLDRLALTGIDEEFQLLREEFTKIQKLFES